MPPGPPSVLLRAAFGNYPHTRPVKSGAVAAPGIDFAFEEFPTINRAFAPMVREQRFDLCELALATYIQARAWGKPLVLLPVITIARFQQAALLTRRGHLADPATWRGRSIGIRSYSQTTGVWLRGILAEQYGVQAQDLHWITQEGAHVAEAADPPWVERVAPGADLLAMLRDGAVDAVILGNELPEDPEVVPLIADQETSVAAFWSRHHLVPVNHVLTLSTPMAAVPGLAAALFRLFAATPHQFGAAPRVSAATGRAAVRPSLSLMLRYCRSQGMVPPGLEEAELWQGLPADVG